MSQNISFNIATGLESTLAPFGGRREGMLRLIERIAHKLISTYRIGLDFEIINTAETHVCRGTVKCIAVNQSMFIISRGNHPVWDKNLRPF